MKIKFSIMVMALAFVSFPALPHLGEVHDETMGEMEQVPLSEKRIENLKLINEKYLEKVKPIFSQKCLSCHGELSAYPWYYAVPGVKQLLDYDIRTAQKHMDMKNDFPFGGHGSPLDDLEALKKSVQKNTMPPLRYKMLHWSSSLTEAEKEIVLGWIDKSLLLIKEEN